MRPFFSQPWSGPMLALAVVSFAYSLGQRRRAAKRAAAQEPAEAKVEFKSPRQLLTSS